MKISEQAFESLVAQFQQRVDTALDHWLPPSSCHPVRLHQAMRYAVLAPGKRVRPILVYATASALGIDLERVDGAACAVEIIHAYSLIHDDLPEWTMMIYGAVDQPAIGSLTKPPPFSPGMRYRHWHFTSSVTTRR